MLIYERPGHEISSSFFSREKNLFVLKMLSGKKRKRSTSYKLFKKYELSQFLLARIIGQQTVFDCLNEKAVGIVLSALNIRENKSKCNELDSPRL